MQGSFFIIAAVGAFVGIALFMPAKITLAARLTMFGGHGEARITWLRFSVRIPLRAFLLGNAPMRVEVLRLDGSVRKCIRLLSKKEPKSKWETALREVLRIRRASVTYAIGVADDPAATALLCAAAHSVTATALPMLLPGMQPKVYAIPVFSQNALKIDFFGIAHVGLGKLIYCRLQRRGE